MTQKARGGCLCGGVSYEVHGALGSVLACHCSKCRRTSGNFVATVRLSTVDLRIVEAETLAWYPSSEAGDRGFCSRCGGNLFWRENASNNRWTWIMAGTLDVPTGLKIEGHVFTADKSDYYEIRDDAPQWEQGAP